VDPIEAKKRKLEEQAKQRRAAMPAASAVPASVGTAAEEMECPQCAELIKRKAKVCRFCRLELDPNPAVVIAAAPVKPATQAAKPVLKMPVHIANSKSVIRVYGCTRSTAVTAAAAAIARLGFTIGNVDQANGVIAFETGMSWSSWAGQKMSIHLVESDGSTQISIGGTMKVHGGQLQIFDWGEAKSIAVKVFNEIDAALGPGLRTNEPTEIGFFGGLIILAIVGWLVVIVLVIVSRR